MAVLAVLPVLDAVGRSLRESFFMFWETLWPLILGFGLSGAVQSFVGRESMQKKMGDHGPASIARASDWPILRQSAGFARAPVTCQW